MEGFIVMDSDFARFPLPKDWPQSIKTAVLHVIALAHVAIVHARGLAVNSRAIRRDILHFFARVLATMASVAPYSGFALLNLCSIGSIRSCRESDGRDD